MHPTIDRQVTSLGQLSGAALRARYAEVFGEAARTSNKVWLIKRIAWRLQALAEGDLPERARLRAAQLAKDADLRLSPPKHSKSQPPEEIPAATPGNLADERLPPPGTLLTRVYKGQTLQVRILLHGFEFNSVVYPSLSAVAKAITGSHCNGYLFFRLSNQGDTP